MHKLSILIILIILISITGFTGIITGTEETITEPGIYHANASSLIIDADDVILTGQNTLLSSITINNHENITLIDLTVNGIITGTDTINLSLINVTVAKNSGIILSGDINTTISASKIYDTTGTGISCIESKNLSISDTTTRNNKITGIVLKKCDEVSLNRVVSNSNFIGISITDTLHLTLNRCTIMNNNINVDISAKSNEFIRHSMDISNLINGKKCIYLVDKHNLTIDSSDNPGILILSECSNIEISDLVMTKTGSGVYISNCNNITLKNIVALDNCYGIKIVHNSSDIRIQNCNFEQNLFYGYQFSASDNISIIDSNVQGSLMGIYGNNISNLMIKNFQANTLVGALKKYPSGIMLNGCNNCDISDSSIDDAGYSGIALINGSDITIKNTEIKKAGIVGILLQTSGVNIDNTKILDSLKTGLLIYADSTTVRNSTITGGVNGVGISDKYSLKFSNNYLANTNNLVITGNLPTGIWNETTGNYWSDMNNSGYSDTCIPEGDFCPQYEITPGNIDYRPLSNQVYSATDLNGNGHNDLSDVVICFQKISSGERDINLDYSGDGRVNLYDVTTLFRLNSK